MKRFLKVIDCTQQLQVRENVVGFEKALGAVEVIKDQIQYRSQSLLTLARGYFSWVIFLNLRVTDQCQDRPSTLQHLSDFSKNVLFFIIS